MIELIEAGGGFVDLKGLFVLRAVYRAGEVPIGEAVVREHRKRRSDLLEAIWEVAWANYQRSGSVQSYAEGRRISRRSKRVSEDLQDQLYTALETILERAPSALIEEVARKLTHWAGRFGEGK